MVFFTYLFFGALYCFFWRRQRASCEGRQTESGGDVQHRATGIEPRPLRFYNINNIMSFMLFFKSVYLESSNLPDLPHELHLNAATNTAGCLVDWNYYLPFTDMNFRKYFGKNKVADCPTQTSSQWKAMSGTFRRGEAHGERTEETGHDVQNQALTPKALKSCFLSELTSSPKLNISRKGLSECWKAAIVTHCIFNIDFTLDRDRDR